MSVCWSAIREVSSIPGNGAEGWDEVPEESAIILIAQPDALDQYFIRHPEDFFERSFETAVVDPDNSPILKAHLTLRRC